MIEYVIPESEDEIQNDCFNGCISLKKVVIHSGVINIGSNAFYGIDFKYAYRDKNGKLILSIEQPTKEEHFDLIEIKKIKDLLDSFDYNIVLKSSNLTSLVTLTENLKANRIKIPDRFIMEFIEKEDLEAFCKNCDFRFFKNELPDIEEVISRQSGIEQLNFYKFAKVLGCFSGAKMTEKDGKESDVIFAQKASSILAKLIRTDVMSIGEYTRLFNLMPMNLIADNDFLKFISVSDSKKYMPNLEMLLDLESEHKGIFAKVMTDFDEAKKYRDSLGDDGKPVRVPWEQALKNFYLENQYIGVTDENRDIADLFNKKRAKQDVFDEASRLRSQAKKENVTEHILGVHLREETILESIERIKNETLKEIDNGREILDELYEKQFTYEWLSKNDPANAIIGVFTSCCATIASQQYGKSIATASIIAKDVQNIVVRDSKGEIISKGTVYINKEKGYAVINDFELNNVYKIHEDELVHGMYDVEEGDKDEVKREMIFKAFKRGIKAFIEEYDRQNPENPLKQINIGMDHNRLKRQMERYEKETKNLSVPVEYEFLDAQKEQRIFYKREEKQKINGGQDR